MQNSEVSMIQENLPPVPSIEVPCEKCSRGMGLINGEIPEKCPHCGYYLRPRKDTIWGNFVFVLCHRYLTWRGRATRKEYWSFSLLAGMIWILISIFVFLIFLKYSAGDDISAFNICGLALPSLSVIILSPLAYILLIGIPKIFLIARRLHDISLSGITVIFHMILLLIMLCIGIAFNCCSNFSVFEKSAHARFTHSVITEESHHSQEYNIGYVSGGDEISTAMDDTSSLPYLYLFSSLNIAAEGLSIFFFIICFINSSRGTNQYGPSRKYPLPA